MTFKAKQIDLAALQQTGVGRAMWYVAGDASFDFHRLVFEDERPLLVDVALEAHGVLRGRGAQLACEESTVWIMAVTALHQSFVNAMMKSAVELLLHLQMAAVAEQWLFFLHEKRPIFAVMRAVAIRAGNVVLQMRGTPIIGVFLAILMASEAPGADLLRRGVLKGKNL
jgi:hypothetical protein